jgi:hypothetical protein
MKKLLLLTIALLFAATSAWAVTNRYVPCDLNTLHVPCYATIQAAIDASSTGDIIIVAAGTYNEYVTVNKSVTLNGANAGIHPAVGTSPTDVVGTRGPETILSSLSPAADNITIDGFEFLKAGTRIIDTYSNANGFTLKNCIVESTVNGPSTGIIQFGGGSHINCTFQYDLFQDLGDHTFYAAGGPYDNLKFQYNKFQSKIDAIFWSATALTGGIIDHNEFDGQSGADNNDINIGLAGNLQVTNNLFHDILYTAIQVGIINGSISGNTFNNYYGLSGSTSAAIQLWGGEWGTPVSTNVSISNNIINYNQQGVGVGPVFGIRLRGPNSPSDPAIDGSTIHIHNNAFYNGGVRNDAFAILFQGNQATSVDAICNWFASVATPNVFQTPIFPSPVTFIPYSISNGGSCTGSGIITNIQPPTSVSGSCSNYDVQITVQNFTNVGSISLRLLYDPAVFTYQSFTPNAAIHSAWGDGSTPGLFILGDDNDLATLPNDAVLFTLHFTLLPAISGNTTNLTWGSNQGDNEYGGPLGPGGSPTYVSEFNPETWTISSGRPVLNFTRGYWYCTIQDAIDASTTTTGDIIKVYPGTYNRDEANGWNYLTGLPGTSNFNIFVNKQLTIEGVDASGNPITNAGSIAAYVIPENDTPPGNLSTIFVQADNVTIQGLDITALNDQNYDYKTISVIGNNCTIQDCNIHALDQVSCIYMYDPRYDATTNTSHIQSYTFDHNIFDPGGVDASGIRFSSGPGWSGPVATRIITYNTFTGGSYSIEFVGPGGDTWDTYPVGAATITHNSFTGADRGSVVAWGQYGTAEGYGTIDWYGILNSNNNTFDKAVITLIPPTSPYNVRSYFTTYSDGDGDHNFYNLRGIYSAIQKYPINHVAQSGDIVEVFSGTYDEQVVVNGLDITIEGAGNSTIIKPSLPTKLTTFYTYPFGTFWPGAILAPIVLVENSGSGNVILHNFEVDGVNVSSLPVGSERLAGILYGESSGTINNVTVTTVKTSGYADRSYGIDLSAVSGTHAVDVENCNITDWARNGIQAMGVSLTANIHDNILVGPGTIGPDNVPNGIVFIHGVGGYATTNTISACHYNSATWGSDGILVYDPVASGISIQYNHVSNCDVGVGVSHNANYATIDQNDLIGNIVGAQIDDGATNNKFTENNIVSNTVAGIFIDGALDLSPGNPPGSGNVANQNNITSNAMGLIDYDATHIFDAICNWWGYNCPAAFSSEITNPEYVNYSTWIVNGIDANLTVAGFQGTHVCTNSIPEPTIAGDVSVCEGSTFEVYTTESGMTNYNWTVTGGDIVNGGTTTDNKVTVTWCTIGTGHVKVNYVNTYGCTATAQTDYPVVVTLTAAPEATWTGSNPYQASVDNTGCTALVNWLGTEQVDYSHLTQYPNNGTADAWQMWQSFTVGTGKTGLLTKVRLNFSCISPGPDACNFNGGGGNFSPDYRIRIFAGEGNDCITSKLYEGTYIAALGWNDIIIPQNLAPFINEGEQYTIELGVDGTMGPNYPRIAVAADWSCTNPFDPGCPPFVPGAMYWDNMPTTNGTIGSEYAAGLVLVMETYTTPIPMAITETCGKITSLVTNHLSGSVFPLGGPTSVTYTITNNGGQTTTATFGVDVTTTLAGSATNSGPVCPGTSLTLTANGIDGAPDYSYAWTGPNSQHYSVSSFTITNASATDNGTWSVVITDSYGCTVTETTTVTLTPITSITTQPSDATICTGASNTFSVVAAGTGTITYQWYSGSTLISGATSASYTTGTAGSYYVIVGSTCGDVTSNTVTLTVNPNLPVSVSLAGDYNPVCSGTTVNFTATPTNGGPGPIYQWIVNGLNVGTNSTAYSYIPSTGDIVEVQLTSNITPCATGNPATSSMTMTVNTCDITGTLKYDNAAYTGLTGMTVTLNSTPSHSSLATVAGGAYTISNVPSGTYTISVNDNGKAVGGINATDAAQVNYYGVGSHPYLIDMVRWFAGDVNNDTYIDPNDASLILGYFVMNGNYPYTISPKWKFWLASGSFIGNRYTGPTNPSVTISSSTISDENLYGMCNGDFNQSFIPAAKEASNSLSLTYGATLQVNAGDEFDLPISTQSAIDVGAVSLILNFPSDKLEIMGVTLADQSNTPVMYNVSGDELRIGWYSREDLSLKAGDKLLTLRVKLLASLDQSETIRFTLAGDQLNELADEMANVIPNAILNIDLVGSALGINPGSGTQTLNFTNYPNPFTGTTTLAYSLPANGAVTIELRNMLGVLDKVIVNNVQQTSGDYKLILDGYDLPDGVYMATLKLISADQTITRTIKIVRTF